MSEQGLDVVRFKRADNKSSRSEKLMPGDQHYRKRAEHAETGKTASGIVSRNTRVISIYRTTIFHFILDWFQIQICTLQSCALIVFVFIRNPRSSQYIQRHRPELFPLASPQLIISRVEKSVRVPGRSLITFSRDSVANLIGISL
jgi:hypothetical protein